ncbi:hypothetical protein GF402_06255 [Candidatus Fermentibacteria bacterium]|nr:hypothetical protein [Candidatus Fermentibacteria bacterium]
MIGGRGWRIALRLTGPTALVLLVLLGSSWYSPGFSSPSQVLVAVGLALVLILAFSDLRLSAGLALVLLVGCSLLFAPDVHLWGDGALRLRNLASKQGVAASGAFEPGDTYLHSMLVGLGMRPEGSFVLVGAAAAAIYMLSCYLFSTSMPSRGAPWVMVLLLAPTWIVFFTGYVESYAPLAALSMLTLALIRRGSTPWAVSTAASLAALFHVLGVALFPGVVFYVLRRRRPAALLPPVMALGALLAWLLLACETLSVPPSFGPRGTMQTLKAMFFSAPGVLAMLTCVGRRARLSLFPPAVMGLLVILFLPMERGPSRDWDLIAVMLLPTYTLLVASLSRRTSILAPTALAALVAAGPAVGSFLEPELSLARFEKTLRADPNAGVYEEAAIYRRDAGRPDLAAELFGKAFRLDRNGRHLAQAAEALRLAGRFDEALDTARKAVELRPSLDVVWTQLAMAARDAGNPGEAVRAARAIEDLSGKGLWGWSVALETALSVRNAQLALQSAEEALRSGGDRDYGVMVNAALAAGMAGANDLAENRLRRAIGIDPSRPLARFDLALLYTRRGDSTAADSLLVKLLGDYPDHDQAESLLRFLRGGP